MIYSLLPITHHYLLPMTYSLLQRENLKIPQFWWPKHEKHIFKSKQLCETHFILCF